MALDVYLLPSVTPLVLDRRYCVCSFDEEEAAYWFLRPLFQELKIQTGEDIDLYDTAIFGGDNLNALTRTLDAALHVTQSQPENWGVSTGQQRQHSGEYTDIYVSLNKQHLLALLAQLQMATRQVRERSQFIVFFGD